MPNRKLFVYGTLKEGGKWHHLLQNSQRLEPGDSILGEMYLFEDVYPVLFRGDDMIRGETYDVPDKDYSRVFELESDANYVIDTVVTDRGHEAEVYFFQDESVKDPERQITEFDAIEYFHRWLEITPRDSESFQFFLEWGGNADQSEFPRRAKRR